MNNNCDSYYTTYGNRYKVTGYMDPDFEGIQPKTVNHPKTGTSLEQCEKRPDTFLQSGTVLVRKWLLAFIILIILMLFCLLTTMILTVSIKIRTVKLKIQRIENENKVMNHYAGEWNLAIMQSLDETYKVR